MRSSSNRSPSLVVCEREESGRRKGERKGERKEEGREKEAEGGRKERREGGREKWHTKKNNSEHKERRSW